ncbi:iron ABC transporter permease [Petroclostridium sp. X23]|uniref:FecCD family ABC transporter permease n=1 Tax=Petroclostridium sp. X23 TaxID=3045146 RepID=UPI0024ACB6F4|nr:iron ABC transporter permease [Petroclostridium sp. X23]WHH58818.1 iron ABC transporter permease [Petroclostridium sp. X23]
MKIRSIHIHKLLLVLIPLLFITVSLFMGRYPISFGMMAKVILAKITGIGGEEIPDTIKTIVWDVRFPRAVMGALVGGSLAISGASFQGVFRNPLVSSGILGVSSGAGFGAALSILIFKSTAFSYIFAFVFGGIAVLLSYMIGRVYNTTPTVMLVLGGTVVSSVFSALISFAKYVADPYDQLPTIVFWLMGSLASLRYQDMIAASIPMILGILGLVAIRWRINILSMGDKEAQALGINMAFNKGLVIFCSTLATAGAVCISGMIGWVGLVIPHIGRMLFGNDNKVLLPASLSLGACFLILVDNIGRIITGSEIPLGILTALVGGPFFVYLLKKTKGSAW